jgi:hypothetical protein
MIKKLMKMTSKSSAIAVFILLAGLVFSCSPKSINTERENLTGASKAWIPFNGNEDIVFVFEDNEMVFSGQGKSTYYENVRYMTDQSGFFTVQEDYYADMQRQELIFETPSSVYYINYYLERNKGETGEWEILRVSVGDGDYYKNEIKIVTQQTDKTDKGEIFTYTETKVLNNVKYDSVYFWKQERRPFEIYYTKKQGIVAFKVSTNELWSLKADSIN